MNSELQILARQLEQARTPEEVFGEISAVGPDQVADLKKSNHRLARAAHPDAYTGRADQLAAQAAFNRLTDWFEIALTKIEAGRYGRSAGRLDDWRVVLQTPKRAYVLEASYEQGPVYTCYPAIFQEGGRSVMVTLKITRDPHDNDLAENEARVIQVLRIGKATGKFGSYLPGLLDSFLYTEDGLIRQVNVFKRPAGWYSLAAVRRAYPSGIDPKDMAWMWQRILVALGFAHLNGVIHRAVLPVNLYILPEQHGLLLTEWSFALNGPETPGASIAMLNPAYTGWYPQEVHRQENALTGTDIDMAARCMIDLLGGDPLIKTMPDTVPQAIRSFFKGCTLAGIRSRPQDAWALKEEFDALIQRLWGERKFHPFLMYEPRRV